MISVCSHMQCEVCRELMVPNEFLAHVSACCSKIGVEWTKDEVSPMESLEVLQNRINILKGENQTLSKQVCDRNEELNQLLTD